MDWDKIYSDLRKRNWIILLVMSSISYFLMNQALTLGIILGGLIIIGNLSVLQHTIRRGFSAEGVMKATKIFIVMKYYLRLLALGIIIAFLIKRGWVDPVGLALGLSTVVIGIISFGIKRALKTAAGEST